jgi:hypothetical protein
MKRYTINQLTRWLIDADRIVNEAEQLHLVEQSTSSRYLLTVAQFLRLSVMRKLAMHQELAQS